MLVLEMILNGRSTGILGNFTARDGALYALPTELSDLGFRVPPDQVGKPDPIALSSIPGLEAKVNEQTQTIVITAGDTALRPQEVNSPRDFRQETSVTRPTIGLALNYAVLGTMSQGQLSGGGQVDARFFSPYGTVSTTALGLFAPVPGEAAFVRLDSNWSYAEPDSLRRWTVGDLITGGLGSSRPVRLGGFQIASDFSLRPDLVTFPLPQLSGSTLVPTTVDVLVNGVRQLSQNVSPGPFEIRSLPIVTGAGEVAIAYQDSLGRQVVTRVPFYASSALLAPGLTAYSVEGGAIREGYSQISNQYGRAALVATARHGLSDWLTLESHFEGTSDLGMASLGGSVRIGALGVLSFTGAGSAGSASSGWMSSAALERSTPTYNIALSGTLASRGFDDIAGLAGSPLPHMSFRVSGGVQLGSVGSLGIAYVRQLPFSVDKSSSAAGGAAISLATMSYQTQLADGLNFYATGYINPRGVDPDTGRPAFGYGGMLGLSFQLGQRYGLGTSASVDSGKASYITQATKSASDIGEFGAHLTDSEGYARRRIGEFEYIDSAGIADLGIDQSPGAVAYRAGFNGSLVIAGDEVFAARSIPDSFAIVRTGDVGGVGVSYENRPIGKTDSSGTLLVPDLRAYQINRITLNATDLPPDITAAKTDVYVRPPEKSGIIVDFGVHGAAAALLRLVDARNQAIPLGTIVQKDGADTAVVGYDGEVYLTELQSENAFNLLLANGERCGVNFPYHHVQGELPTIGPLRCQ